MPALMESSSVSILFKIVINQLDIAYLIKFNYPLNNLINLVIVDFDDLVLRMKKGVPEPSIKPCFDF